MSQFQVISSDDPIREVIKAAFDADLQLGGGWGYTQETATVIHDTNALPIEQFEHTLATMRAYIEMNMTRPQEERYGSINANETGREQISEAERLYDRVTYEVTGMKEDQYADFINEYKENSSRPDFDYGDHFNRRKEATLKRIVEHWFERSSIV